MADDQDEEQKTEQPTQKRLEEAAKKGNIAMSREVSSFLMLAVLALTVVGFAPSIARNTQILLTPFLSDADSLPTDAGGLGHMLQKVILSGFMIIAAPLISALVAALAAGFLQNGFVLNSEAFTFKFDRISPLAGVKRMFSMRSVVEFIKSLAKIILVGVVGFLAIYPEMAHLRQLPNESMRNILLFLALLATRMTIGAAIVMFFIAIFDVIYQRFQYMKSLRMSKQEIKDEYKQSEGDPVIKQRLRRLRMERARQRMMANVPKADVVITNPTHFAVALKYDVKLMKAPTLVAKGQDLIALRIREIAEENDVPIVENPPLARALFSSTDLDKEIPITHYEAVAKIISYVYKLKGRKS